MDRRVKAAVLILVFFLILSVCALGLNALDFGIGNELEAEDNCVSAGDFRSNKLYRVAGIRPEDQQSLTLTIDLTESGEDCSILIDHLAFVHEISIDGVIVSQNADNEADRYDGGYTCKVFDIGDYPVGEITLRIEGDGVSGVAVYLARSQAMHDRVQIRLVCTTVMLLLMILMTLTAAFLYFSKRINRFFLVFALIGAVSAIKAICTGELSVIAGALGFSAQNCAAWNNVLSAANLFLPLAVMINLLNIRIDRRLQAALVTLGVGLTAANGIVGSPSLLYLVMTVAVYLTALALSVFGCVRKKRYSTAIFVNNAVYSALVTYAFLINAGALSGGLDFYVYPAYLGAEIYLLSYFVVFIIEFFSEHRQLEKEKKEFERVTLLRGIGHDLKLPLSVIKMNNQMLAKYDLTEDERKECAELSTEAALELEKMTDNINSFLNLQNVTDKAYAASLRECFDKAARRYAALSESIGCSFSASWEGPDALLPISALQLERMLYNLLDNALKYGEKGGSLALSCLVEPKRALVTVRDDGTGMEKQQMEKIFEPFYRADSSRTKEGLGLGLAVVKGIVDSLKGQIKVESEPGKGTQITVILPTE